MEDAKAKAEAMMKKGSDTAQNAFNNVLKGFGSIGRSAQGKLDLALELIYTLKGSSIKNIIFHLEGLDIS